MDVLHYLTKELKTCNVFSTVSQAEDQDAWLAARSRGIGGSDVGAICGVNDYSSPRLMYLKKTGQFEDSVANTGFSDAALDRMWFGTVLEPIVADEYQRRSGNKVVVSPATLSHVDHPWALANVDRLIVDDNGIPYGVLECKTAGEFMNEGWEGGELPLSYIYQLNWYLWVTGLKHGAFACLVGGNKFYFYDIYRNDELLENEIIPKVMEFWNVNVKQLIEPPLCGTDADCQFVSDANPESQVVRNSEMTLETYVDNELASNVYNLKAEIKRLTIALDESINRLKDRLKCTEFGYTKDHTIRWAPRQQVRIDTDKVKAQFPDVYEQCKKVIKYRVFTVK